MARDRTKALEWGSGKRSKTSNKLGSPVPADGSNGDIEVRQTNLGGKIFAKLGGRWYNTPLSLDDTIRLGVNLSDHLSIDQDSIDIHKNNAKVAQFGSEVIIGEVGASKSNVQITSGAINLRTNTTSKLILDSSGNITTKGIVKIQTAASDGDLGFLLENDGAGYNQMMMKGANPEIWMGYSGSGTSITGNNIGEDGDINGSSKIYMNRQQSDLMSAIIFAYVDSGSGVQHHSIGGHDAEFRIVTGGDVRTDGNRALYVDSSKDIYLPQTYSSTAGSANVSIASSGKLTRITSSKTYKDNINYNGVNASVLYNMKPCSYTEKTTNTEFIGFIAEDVHEIEPRLIEYRDISEPNEEDNDTVVQPELVPDAIKYDHISAILVKAVQELSAKIDAMQIEINNLK